MKKIFLLGIVLFLISNLFAQDSVKRAQENEKKGADEFKKITGKTLWFIDSIQVDRKEFFKTDPNTIGSISIIRNKSDGMDSILYVETDVFCRKRYWKFLSSKSAEYLKIVPNAESDTTVQYVLNGAPLTKANNAKLIGVDSKNLINIQVVQLDPSKLPGNPNKKYGVIVVYKAEERKEGN